MQKAYAEESNEYKKVRRKSRQEEKARKREMNIKNKIKEAKAGGGG